MGWGVLGIWLGLCFGLMIIGTALVVAWRRKNLSDSAGFDGAA
jgi:hypothetical protein